MYREHSVLHITAKMATITVYAVSVVARDSEHFLVISCCNIVGNITAVKYAALPFLQRVTH
jgi:hypothetical protein